MKEELIQLYPERREPADRQGLFLSENLHRQKTAVVYACFLSSLDGRIAVQRDGMEALPERLSNPSDLSFFYELEAQADCIITNGSYMRARAEGRLGDILHIGRQPGGYAYLAEWRRREKLPAEPMIVVCSRSLRFPEPDDLPRSKIIIAASGSDCSAKASEWRRRGYTVFTMEEDTMGQRLAAKLKSLGCRSIFLAAGPIVFESIFAGRALDRLYLTLSHQLLGGKLFRTFTDGLGRDLPPCQLQQRWLFYDRSSRLGYAQWYACFSCRYSSDAQAQ